jgi:hypothetical protein
MTDARGSDQPDDPLDALHAHNARVRAARGRAVARRRVLRVLAWGALLAALALIGLGIALRAGAFDDDPVTSRAASLPPPTTASSPTTTTTAAAPTTAVAAPPPASPVTFVVRATRGDSWMEVRVGTSTGRVLYSGILHSGTSDRETGRTLWVRFGSVGNVDLTLNGKPVQTASSGTVETLVTPDGLRPS